MASYGPRRRDDCWRELTSGSGEGPDFYPPSVTSLLQTATGDLDFTSRNLVLVTDLAILVKQKARNILRLFLAEWFLDITKGFPWFQLVLGIKNPNLSTIKTAIRSRMLGIEGVAEVTDISLDFDRQTRDLQYSLELRLTDGTTVEVT